MSDGLETIFLEVLPVRLCVHGHMRVLTIFEAE